MEQALVFARRRAYTTILWRILQELSEVNASIPSYETTKRTLEDCQAPKGSSIEF